MHENMVKNEFLFSFPSDAENCQKKYFGEAQEYFFLLCGPWIEFTFNWVLLNYFSLLFLSRKNSNYT